MRSLNNYANVDTHNNIDTDEYERLIETGEICRLDPNELLPYVQKAKEGDQVAFKVLYDATAKSVLYLIKSKVGDEEESRDIMQEVYFQAFKSLKNLKHDITFIAWLNKIAINKYIDSTRANEKKDEAESIYEIDEDMEDLNEEFLPEVVLLKEEARNVVLNAIKSLPEAQRQAIFMYYYNNMTSVEISKAEQVPEGVIRKRLFDGRKAIKQKLQLIIDSEVN